MSTVKVGDYRCNKCRKIVKRESSKAWIPSHCVQTGKSSRMYLVKGSK